jgi:hypothetical protein
MKRRNEGKAQRCQQCPYLERVGILQPRVVGEETAELDGIAERRDTLHGRLAILLAAEGTGRRRALIIMTLPSQGPTMVHFRFKVLAIGPIHSHLTELTSDSRCTSDISPPRG